LFGGGKFFASGEKPPIELIISTLQFGRFWGAKNKYKDYKELTKNQKEEIVNAMRECNWVMSRAARKLGITERMIGYKIKKYKIKKEVKYTEDDPMCNQ